MVLSLPHSRPAKEFSHDEHRGEVSKGVRVSPSAFRALDLRAHQLLSDAPLHDVWCFRLHGGGPGVTVRDVMEVFVEIDGSRVDPAARVLFALRAIMGRLFGWDREVPPAPARSYVNRLSEEDRARSLDTPGSKRGFWTTVYTFDREALGEVINHTAQVQGVVATVPC